MAATLDDAQVLMLQLEVPVEVSLAAAREAKVPGKDRDPRSWPRPAISPGNSFNLADVM